MKCTHVQVGGVHAIVCSSGGRGYRPHRCSECGRALSATLQCDWKVGEGKTCDAWLCKLCALEVGPDKHLCRAHQVAYEEWKKKRCAPAESPPRSDASTMG